MPDGGHNAALYADLVAAWSAPGRGYHDLVHLTEVLEHLDRLLDDLGNPVGRDVDVTALRLAAWFHDAVYDGAADDEERSAQWAEAAIEERPLADEVARLVRLTTTHRTEPDDTAGAVLCDADLAILAAPAERYAAYVAGVRHEYAQFDDVTFALGRAAVLEELLGADHLYATQRGRELWEERARANVRAELVSLRAVADPAGSTASDSADRPSADD